MSTQIQQPVWILLLVDGDAEKLLDRLENYDVPFVPKWVGREER